MNKIPEAFYRMFPTEDLDTVVETSSNTTIKPVNYLEIVLRVANGL